MDSQAGPPHRLLQELAQGTIADDDLEILQAMLRAEGLAVCPPEARTEASRLAQPRPQLVTSDRAIGEQLRHLAHLIFDSWHTPTLASVRSHSPQSRQLLLRAPDAEINLHVQAADANHLTLIGQILGPEQRAREAWLVPAALPSHTASPDTQAQAERPYGPVRVDDLGEFVLDQIQPGRYLLSVQGDVWRIDSVALQLSAKPGDAVQQPDM